jgi:hypothetical protein
MAEEAATNPVEGEDKAEATLPDNQEVDNENRQADDEELPEGEQPEGENEEVEHDGRKYLVPKALKPLLLMQADYTRKTQEVAQQRQAVLAERQAMHQIGQAEFQAAANAQSAQSRVAQWDAYAQQMGGWAAWARQDPFAAQEANMDRAEHERVAQAHLGQLEQLRGQRQSVAQRETAQRIEQGRQTLATEIPGWGDELRAKLIDYAVGQGFSRQELDDLEADPRVAKVLHAAFSGSQATTTQKKVQNIVAAQQAQPAAVVRAPSAPAGKLSDRTGTDEWMRQRNADVRKRK